MWDQQQDLKPLKREHGADEDEENGSPQKRQCKKEPSEPLHLVTGNVQSAKLADLKPLSNLNLKFNDKTAQHIIAKGYQSQGMIVGSLKETFIKDLTFSAGQNVRVLIIANPNIEPENFKWLLASCPNVVEIQVELYETKKYGLTHSINILNSQLPTCINTWKNLEKVDICVSRISSLYEHSFDWKHIKQCSNLKYLNIRSHGEFSITNCARLPSSLRRFNVVYILSANEYSAVWKELLIEFPHLDSTPSYKPSQSEVESIKQYMKLVSFKIMPALQSEWEIFQTDLPKIIKRLRLTENDCHYYSNILFSFSMNQLQLNP